ncbi:glycerol uptake protein 1 [Rhypophila decipiens]
MAPNDSGGPLSFIKSIYALDTIDTRFTTPSGVPYRRRQNETDGNGKREDDDIKSGMGLLERTATATSTTSSGVTESGIQAETLRTKWGTPEFYLYYLIVGIAVPYMFWVAYDVSRPSDPRYRRYEPWLSEGWIPGRKIDLSDFQYGHLRRNLPVMGLLLIFHPLGRQLWNFIFPIRQQQTRGNTPISGRSSPFQRSPTPTPEAADARLRQRTSYDFTFAIIFLIILHGFSAAKILFILALNYKIGTALPKKYVPATTWIFNLIVLFANELCDGYKFRSIAVVLTGGAPPPGEVPNLLVSFGTWLDSYRGLQPKWAVLFNITILRLISFNLDYYWNLDRRSGSPIEKKQLDPANLSERDRVAISANRDDYTFTNYVAYAIYAPLYLTGPILTFNDYISQCRYKPATIETSRTIKYAIRFALVLLSMEIILHYDYVGAITKARPIWSSYTPAQISLLSFFNLHIIWLKLLVPWRLFRLWSLVDGIDPPENMIRCVSNNYSTLSFWRSWHRSYYRWLLRYIYIPLGGTSFRTWVGAARSIVTYLTVFTFVALWHDIKMRLLIWGWLIVFFFLPEIVAGYLFPRKKWESKPVQYRMLCAAGGVLNVLMMISANLVGFAVGLDGLETIIRGVLREWNGLIFILMASGILFVGIQVMFEIRSSELRKGINLKC